jgi:hypothetical protein
MCIGGHGGALRERFRQPLQFLYRLRIFDVTS